MDHLGYAPVGQCMKSPRFPVWVIYAENHYSVLFAVMTLDVSTTTTPFDVYYYDPLGKQEDTFRITIGT